MKPLKFLLFFFLVISLIKAFLSLQIHSPHIVMDESLYGNIATQIWHNHTYIIDSSYGAQYPPLYPLLLSPLTSFSVTKFFQYSLILNAFLSSSIVFPTYSIAKEYLREDKSILTTVLVGIMPPSFIYTFTLMSENLFFPLFLCSVYFIKKSFDDDNFKNNLLASIFISLSILTKLIGIPLVAIYFIVKVYKKWIDMTNENKK